MDLVEQRSHNLEPSSDSEGSSFSIKTPDQPREETPPSSNDRDDDVEWGDAPMVDDDTNVRLISRNASRRSKAASASSASGEKPH